MFKAIRKLYIKYIKAFKLTTPHPVAFPGVLNQARSASSLGELARKILVTTGWKEVEFFMNWATHRKRLWSFSNLMPVTGGWKTSKCWINHIGVFWRFPPAQTWGSTPPFPLELRHALFVVAYLGPLEVVMMLQASQQRRPKGKAWLSVKSVELEGLRCRGFFLLP